MGALGDRDSFSDAIDRGDFGEAASIMKRAGVGTETIQPILKKIFKADSGH
jgi:hypothetical protein